MTGKAVSSAGTVEGMKSLNDVEDLAQLADHINACLRASAIGDALGADIELASLAEIRRRSTRQGSIQSTAGEHS